MSFMANIVRFLIKICFIPVNYDMIEQKISFRFCSSAFITFFIINYGILLSSNVLLYSTTASIQDKITEYMENLNIIDFISDIIFGLFTSWLAPCCLVLLAKGIPKIEVIALADDLKWPTHGGKHILSLFLCVLGALAPTVALWVMMFDKGNVNISTSESVLINLIYFVQYVLYGVCWTIPILMVSIWMEKLISMSKDKSPCDEIERAQTCIELYKSFNSGFGSYFLFMFSFTQVSLIFSFFISISRVLGSNETALVKVIISLGNFLASSGMMVNIACLTFVLEDGYKSVTSLVQQLQDKIMSDVPNRRLIKNIIKELESIKPLTGNGYFSISRGTLTSMVSVGITYIIILVQFKISAS